MKKIRKSYISLLLPLFPILFILHSETGDFSHKLFRLAFTAVGIVCIFIGIIMPKIKINHWIGFRIKCTMDNPEIWRQVHQTAGVLWFIGGYLIAFEAAFVPLYLVVPIVLGIVFLLCSFSLTHAALLAKKKQAKRNNHNY